MSDHDPPSAGWPAEPAWTHEPAEPAWAHEQEGPMPPVWAASPWPERSGSGTFLPLPYSPAEAAPVTRSRGRRWLSWGVAVVLVAGAGGLGLLAWRNDRSAQRWRDLERVQAGRAAALTAQLQTANSRISGLDAQLSTLDAETGSLQNQLSSVADQKEKAVDQETVLHQLLGAAGTVADDLQQCISGTNQFDSDLNSAVDSGQLDQITALQPEAAQVDQTCNQAETANQDLQSAIQSAP